jgi:hypothetical protein
MPMVVIAPDEMFEEKVSNMQEGRGARWPPYF